MLAHGVMLLLACVTTKVWLTLVAAFQFPLPACEAVIVVVPAPTTLRVLPLIVATLPALET